ncbi:Retrovirus-related Pol polyprotein from transposon TNT 1-94 [Glycine soja]
MTGSTQRFKIQLFDGKINFMIWQSTIQDLLVQQGLDQALEDERPVSINETEWTKIQRRAMSKIRLALVPEIKHNVLKEKTSKVLWEKLENIYASKSLTNRLCLKMELYQLKMEMGGDLHDHINKFKQLVSQLLNANDKLFDKEQTLLLLASLSRSFKALVQMLFVERLTLNLDEVIAALRVNERMIRTENINDEHHAIVVVKSEQGRIIQGDMMSKEEDQNRNYVHNEI